MALPNNIITRLIDKFLNMMHVYKTVTHLADGTQITDAHVTQFSPMLFKDNNGNYRLRCRVGDVHIEEFGAVGYQGASFGDEYSLTMPTDADGNALTSATVVDSSPALQKAINFTVAFGGRAVIGNGKYFFRSTVNIQNRTHIKTSPNTSLVPLMQGTGKYNPTDTNQTVSLQAGDAFPTASMAIFLNVDGVQEWSIKGGGLIDLRACAYTIGLYQSGFFWGWYDCSYNQNSELRYIGGNIGQVAPNTTDTIIYQAGTAAVASSSKNLRWGVDTTAPGKIYQIWSDGTWHDYTGGMFNTCMRLEVDGNNVHITMAKHEVYMMRGFRGLELITLNQGWINDNIFTGHISKMINGHIHLINRQKDGSGSLALNYFDQISFQSEAQYMNDTGTFVFCDGWQNTFGYVWDLQWQSRYHTYYFIFSSLSAYNKMPTGGVVGILDQGTNYAASGNIALTRESVTNPYSETWVDILRFGNSPVGFSQSSTMMTGQGTGFTQIQNPTNAINQSKGANFPNNCIIGKDSIRTTIIDPTAATPTHAAWFSFNSPIARFTSNNLIIELMAWIYNGADNALVDIICPDAGFNATYSIAESNFDNSPAYITISLPDTFGRIWVYIRTNDNTTKVDLVKLSAYTQTYKTLGGGYARDTVNLLDNDVNGNVAIKNKSYITPQPDVKKHRLPVMNSGTLNNALHDRLEYVPLFRLFGMSSGSGGTDIVSAPGNFNSISYSWYQIGNIVFLRILFDVKNGGAGNINWPVPIDWSVNGGNGDLTYESQGTSFDAHPWGTGYYFGNIIPNQSNYIEVSCHYTTTATPIVPAYLKQKNADWNETDNTQPDFIKNKPTIPAAQIQSDWNQTDNTKLDFIKNKPAILSNGNMTLIEAAGSGMFNTSPDLYLQIGTVGTDYALNIAAGTFVSSKKGMLRIKLAGTVQTSANPTHLLLEFSQGSIIANMQITPDFAADNVLRNFYVEFVATSRQSAGLFYSNTIAQIDTNVISHFSGSVGPNPNTIDFTQAFTIKIALSVSDANMNISVLPFTAEAAII